jgi:hypothetical protein
MEKIKISELFFVSCFFCLLLTNLFSISFLSYFDEILGIVAFFGIILYWLLNRNDHCFQDSCIILLLILFFGLVGNFVCSINPINISYILFDLFMFSKPYLVFMGSYLFLKKFASRDWLQPIRSFSKISLIIIFCFCVIYWISGRTLFSNGTNFAFFSGHPVAMSVCVLSLIFSLYLENSKTNIIYFALALLIILSGGAGTGVLGIFLLFFFNIFWKRLNFNMAFLVVLIFFGLVISQNELQSYIFNSSSVRYLMVHYGLTIAKTNFPFGSGFASFGSVAAYENYSQLYFFYGINNIYGLGPNGGTYIYDTYYAMLFGEFGFIGAFLFVAFVFSLSKKLFSTNKNQNFCIIGCILFFFAICLGMNIGGSEGCLILMCASFFYFNKNKYRSSKEKKTLSFFYGVKAI